MDTARVRPATAGDEDDVARVCRAGYALSSAGLVPPAEVRRLSDLFYDVDRVRSELTPDPARGWLGYVVAVDDEDRVLGAAGGAVRDGGRGDLLVLYVEPDLRGRGVGSALLDAVTAQQRQHGVTEQWVHVTEGNELGLPFYRARGFVPRDRVPYVRDDDGSPVVFSLVLARSVAEIVADPTTRVPS